MLTLRTEQHVVGLSAQAAYEFLTTFEDADYQAWWPGTHLKVISYRRFPNHVGSLYYLDQFIGDYRVKATETIVEAIPNRRIVRQVVMLGMRIPVRMSFEFADDERGVLITHIITAGFSGLGRVLDPAFRLYFTNRFAAAMDRHMCEELLLLKERIPERKRRAETVPPGN